MLLHALLGALILRAIFPRASSRQRRDWVRWWSARLMRIAGVRVEVEGTPPAEGEVAAMIAANHVSWIDIFAISSVRATRFVAKSEIRDWPLAGWIAERAGTIFIRRDRRRDTARINELVHAALGEADRVGLFPEGTTTEGDALLAFHSSLFEPAVLNRAHVHPCAVRYEGADGSLCRAMAFVGETTFMQSLGSVLRQKHVVARIRFAPPIDAGGLGRREVAAAAHASVASLLRLRPGTQRRTPRDPAAAPR